MLTETDIDKFYKDFESMKLVKPVAIMAQATGLSTGNVSEYLSRKKKPSERFIRVFYDKIYKSSTNVPRDTVSLGNTEPGEKDLLRILMQQMTNLMQTQNNLLQDQKEQVVDKVNDIDTNLKQVLGAVIKIESDIHASKEVALKSLARLERLPEESLTGEAHKIVKRRVLGHKK